MRPAEDLLIPRACYAPAPFATHVPSFEHPYSLSRRSQSLPQRDSSSRRPFRPRPHRQSEEYPAHCDARAELRPGHLAARVTDPGKWLPALPNRSSPIVWESCIRRSIPAGCLIRGKLRARLRPLLPARPLLPELGTLSRAFGIPLNRNFVRLGASAAAIAHALAEQGSDGSHDMTAQFIGLERSVGNTSNTQEGVLLFSRRRERSQ